ncbi:hypothetical protein VMUT_0490 [Vulcanisaeta moutnovskia 768-28]|uniref:Uncharacterized protein n=1 Tax=Vulcanisaeta moutnovskia (strain 768-28) TaxID=985053 RepID=F0QUP0_VULM7|nr:hypothetical protein [Vulcanisaeta moutnovskia]ADY00701.1 hypothetical protein VMUT_0490 [Vulcanisaeta moutnovskia 768-28]
MFHDYETEFIKVLRLELRNLGIELTDEQLNRVRVCVNELKRRHLPLSEAKEIARIIAQILSENPLVTSTREDVRQFLSVISSCRLVGFQLRRHESIYCPIMVPMGFIGISIIAISTSSGNVTLLIKRVGEPVSDNAYYAEDITLVGYFDISNVVWTQRMNPGIYLVEINNLYGNDVNISIDVVTCILETKKD